jgi:phage terminase large subunit GpA-like protein
MIARLAQRAAAAFRVAFAAKTQIDILQWADTKRIIAAESGAAEPGPYSSARTPYAREVMRVMSDMTIRRVVLLWGAQLAKSTIFENVIGWTIDEEPRSILMVQPTVEFAESFSKERFTTMVEATPSLAKKVREQKSRSVDNTLRLKLFPGGFFAIVGSNAPAGLAGRPIGRVLVDEADRFKDSAGTEGDPIALAEKRTATFADAQVDIASTPGNKGESIIEPEFEGGDQRHYFVPCPHCAHSQTLRWGDPTSPFGLKWDHGKPETAAYLCEKCGALIEEQFKAEMLERGEWRAQNPDGRYPSFFLNGLYSPFGGSTWALLVEDFLKARNIPEKLKVFVNTVLAETWEQPGESIKSHTLLARLEAYPRIVPPNQRDAVESIPKAAALLTAGVDVQADRLEYQVWGWGEEEESWLIRVEQIPGDPGTLGPWRELTALRHDPILHETGIWIRPSCVMVDTGYHTAAAYAYCREFVAENVCAAKGIQGDGIHILGKPSRQSQAKVLVYPIGTFAAKEKFLRSQLRVPAGEPGYVHLPEWATVEILEQLTAERLVRHLVRGKVKREWENVAPNRRNEALDIRILSMAALHRLGAGTVRDLGKLAAQLAARAEHPAAAAPQESDEEARFHGVPRRQPRNYVQSWRD